MDSFKESLGSYILGLFWALCVASAVFFWVHERIADNNKERTRLNAEKTVQQQALDRLMAGEDLKRQDIVYLTAQVDDKGKTSEDLIMEIDTWLFRHDIVIISHTKWEAKITEISRAIQRIRPITADPPQPK
ncbi:MAG: hypothetical protein WCT26_04665 [Candidatus Buchananbacteria bacterium]|jgi:hypothetical protein